MVVCRAAARWVRFRVRLLHSSSLGLPASAFTHKHCAPTPAPYTSACPLSPSPMPFPSRSLSPLSRRPTCLLREPPSCLFSCRQLPLSCCLSCCALAASLDVFPSSSLAASLVGKLLRSCCLSLLNYRPLLPPSCPLSRAALSSPLLPLPPTAPQLSPLSFLPSLSLLHSSPPFASFHYRQLLSLSLASLSFSPSAASLCLSTGHRLPALVLRSRRRGVRGTLRRQSENQGSTGTQLACEMRAGAPPRPRFRVTNARRQLYLNWLKTAPQTCTRGEVENCSADMTWKNLAAHNFDAARWDSMVEITPQPIFRASVLYTRW